MAEWEPAGGMAGRGEAALGVCAMKSGLPDVAGAQGCPMREERGMGGRMAMNAAPGAAEGCPMHGGAGLKGRAGGAPRD